MVIITAVVVSLAIIATVSFASIGVHRAHRRHRRRHPKSPRFLPFQIVETTYTESPPLVHRRPEHRHFRTAPQAPSLSTVSEESLLLSS